MSKKVLVTGSNGQLGSCIQELVNAGKLADYEFIFTNSSTLNITDEKVIESFFLSNRIDFCINCAAYTAVDKAEDEVEQAFLVNADAVGFLAEACKEQNATFIHISTDYVFDGTKREPYLPTDTTNPINIYGKSKLKGEELAMQKNDKTIIIRTSWVYSEYGNNFVKTMRRLFQEKEELSIVSDQVGKPTNALKLAAYILEIMQHEKTTYGIKHYASDAVTTWLDFAKQIAQEQNSNIKLNPILTKDYPTKATRPMYSVLGE